MTNKTFFLANAVMASIFIALALMASDTPWFPWPNFAGLGLFYFILRNIK